MSRYASIAEEHWREFLPKAYASIKEQDRKAFFERLADEALTQITDLGDALKGPDPADEPFAEKMSRYMWAHRNAESQVIREVLLIEPEATPEPEPEDEEIQAAFNEFQRLRETLNRP